MGGRSVDTYNCRVLSLGCYPALSNQGGSRNNINLVTISSSTCSNQLIDVHLYLLMMSGPLTPSDPSLSAFSIVHIFGNVP